MKVEKTLAKALRNAVRDLRDTGIHGHVSQPEKRENALASIESVAEALEELAVNDVRT
jgi:hypothetical protein